jgi:hypothetical protein
VCDNDADREEILEQHRRPTAPSWLNSAASFASTHRGDLQVQVLNVGVVLVDRPLVRRASSRRAESR